MKKTVKLLSMLMIAILVISTFQSVALAAAPQGAGQGAGSVVNGIKANTESIDSSGMQTMAGKILGLIQIATAVMAVILVAVFGFKFVLGSAQEKSDYQKSFIPLIVGVVVVFAASSIAKMIFGIAGS